MAPVGLHSDQALGVTSELRLGSLPSDIYTSEQMQQGESLGKARSEAVIMPSPVIKLMPLAQAVSP